MKLGFGLIYRKIFKNKIFKNDEEALAFIWLILKASHKQRTVTYRGMKIRLKTGQISITTRDFGKRLGWSQSKAARFFNKLLTHGMVQAVTQQGEKVTQRATVLTLCNYSKYQNGKNAPDSENRKSDSGNDSGGDSMNNTLLEQNIIEQIKITREQAEIMFEKIRKKHGSFSIPQGNIDLPDSFREIAVKKSHKNPDDEWQNFINYCRAHDKRYANFKAAWRFWVGNSFKFGKVANNNHSGRTFSSGHAAVEGARLVMASSNYENSGLF